MKRSLPILPLVAEWEPHENRCSIAEGLKLDVQTSTPLAESCDDTFDDLPLPSGRADAVVCQLVDHDNAEEASPESYVMHIEPTGIRIAASDEAGWFYGLQTLRQLVAIYREQMTIPCGVLKDKPRFRWRGFMLDSARHLQPVDWIKQQMDRMAALKMNRFHWHLCDDQGWRAEIQRYPQLTEKAAWRGEGRHRYGGFYTQAQMRDIVEYARRRCITVIPEIEMPGHCNAALVALPQLSCTGQPLQLADRGWDAYTRLAGRHAFCAGNEQTFTFLAHVLEEIDDVFDAPWLHLGGDETPREQWEHCPKCQALMQQHDLRDSAALRRHFLRRVDAFSRKTLHKPTIAWTEGITSDMPAEQIVQAWFPGEAATAARLGYQVINSNHEWTYLDYPASEADAMRKPDWMIVLSPEKVYHFDPLPDGLEETYADRVLGAEIPMWTEHMPDEDERENQLMPRLAAFAETLWSRRFGRSFNDFRARLSTLQHHGLLTKTTERHKALLDDAAMPSGLKSFAKY